MDEVVPPNAICLAWLYEVRSLVLYSPVPLPENTNHCCWCGTPSLVACTIVTSWETQFAGLSLNIPRRLHPVRRVDG